MITEHLSKWMSYGCSSDGKINGQFTDISGNLTVINAGTYITDRYFTVNADGQDLGRSRHGIRLAGMLVDQIEIHLPNSPSILNNYKDSNGKPKNRSLD